jgi:hypothetical protein
MNLAQLYCYPVVVICCTVLTILVMVTVAVLVFSKKGKEGYNE